MSHHHQIAHLRRWKEEGDVARQSAAVRGRYEVETPALAITLMTPPTQPLYLDGHGRYVLRCCSYISDQLVRRHRPLLLGAKRDALAAECDRLREALRVATAPPTADELSAAVRDWYGLDARHVKAAPNERGIAEALLRARAKRASEALENIE